MTIHSPPGRVLSVINVYGWTMGCVLHCTEHFSQCKVHYPLPHQDGWRDQTVQGALSFTTPRWVERPNYFKHVVLNY